MRRNSCVFAFGAGLLATASFSGFALAQQAGAGDSADEAQPTEIVITATRQNTSLADTAAAVSAISSQDLGPGGIQDISDLQSSVPNVSIGEQFGVNRTFIRGIGMTSIDLGADGAVAFLQDGAMISRPAAQLAGFYDLAQIEVLRGPQGTLYGRGATGGAINLVTAKPTEEFAGYIRGTYGNYDAVTLEGAVGGPIVADKLLFRIAGKKEDRDGYGKNLFTGSDVDNRDAYAVRGILEARLSPELTASLIVEHYEEDDNNYAFHYFGPTIVPAESLPHKLLGGETIFDYYAARGEKPNLRNVYSDEDPINIRNGENYTALVEWDSGDFNIKSITAYRDFYRFNRTDLDVSDVWMFGQNNYVEDANSFSQEVLLNYKSGGLDILAGAMYFEEELYGEVKVPTINLGLLFGLPADTFDDGNYFQRGTVDTKSYGIFAQAAFDLTSQLRVTAGARYSYERRKGVGRFTFDAVGIDIPTDRKKGWGAITPKLLVEWRPADETLIYGTVTRGFKSGVINVGSANSVIDPEFVWNYEAGFKQQFADNRILLSGAVFYYDYTDLQVGFVNAQSIVETINAGSAKNYGAELELSGRVNENLTLNAYAAYLNAKFQDFCNGYYGAGVSRPGISYDPCPSDPALADLDGKRLPNAPKFSFGAGFDYTVDVGPGELTLGADMSYQSKVYFTEFNNSDAVQDGYALVNANLTYKHESGLSASLWARNLTDEFAISNNIVTAPTFALVRVGSVIPPRTYGFTLGYTF